MIENANWTAPAAALDNLQQLQVKFTLPEDNDFVSALFSVGDHPVEIDRKQVRFHLLKQLRESRQMIMAVVLVVDHANVFDSLLLQFLDNCELVFGFAKP